MYQPWFHSTNAFWQHVRLLALAALLNGQRLEIALERVDGQVQLLDVQTLHVLQHELWHQLPVLQTQKSVG